MDYCYNVYLFFGLKTAPVGFQVCRLFISVVFMLKKHLLTISLFRLKCVYVYMCI